MYKLVILADDFTGALDTGVQFSKQGISTFVTADKEYDFSKPSMDAQVLVVDLESRHLDADKAYENAASVARKALEAGIGNIYKKTDSGLRGNIGSELTSIVDVNGGKSIPFIPAFPKVKRTTEKGIHYIDGVPVTRSVFGKDPFNPVKNDNVADIIREQSSIETHIVTIDDIDDFDIEEIQGRIIIFDAVTDEDMERIARKLDESGTLSIAAGCAGFAEYLPRLFGIDADQQGKTDVFGGFIAVSGSINPITMKQIDYACQHGFKTITLKPEDKLAQNMMELPHIKDLTGEIEGIYQKEGRVIIEASSSRETMEITDRMAKQMGLDQEETRERIALNMGRLVGFLANRSIERTFVIFGGDTLRAAINALGCNGIMPIWEIDNGLVFSKAIAGTGRINIISKSGGFGKADTLVKIEDFLGLKSGKKDKNTID